MIGMNNLLFGRNLILLCKIDKVAWVGLAGTNCDLCCCTLGELLFKY